MTRPRRPRAQRAHIDTTIEDLIAGRRIAYSPEAWRALRDAVYFRKPPIDDAATQRGVDLLAQWLANDLWPRRP